jgi:retinol dehydrogenase-14
MDMHGKVVLITGGNTGIGKATAIALAKQGAQVVFTSRSHEKGQAALAEIAASPATRASRACASTSRRSPSVRAFAAEFLASYPRLDVLILNAGLMLASARRRRTGSSRRSGSITSGTSR